MAIKKKNKRQDLPCEMSETKLRSELNYLKDVEAMEKEGFPHHEHHSSHSHDHHHGHHHHNNDDNKTFITKIIFGLIFTLGGLYYKEYISLAFFFIAYMIVGGDILYLALKNIINGNIFDENFLMAVATVGAFIIGQYPEAITVMLLYKIGEHLQEKAVTKSKDSVADLMNIRPSYANLKCSNGDIKRVSPSEIYVDDIILVKPGEKIPLDGIVLRGESQIDTSSLTGESTPEVVRKRDAVLAGTINKSGLLEIKVTCEYAESTVSKILHLVENASSNKAVTEKFITRFARIYTPIVVTLAFIIALVPPFILKEPFPLWTYRALSFLVVSCPCALVISIPLSYFAGIGAAAKCGILIKGANYLEALSKAEAIVLDKTGTLTEGSFKVSKIITNGFMAEDMLLEYAAYAEMYSNHPIAKSIIKAYKNSTVKPLLDKSRIKSFQEYPGMGVKIYLGDRYIYAGNYKLMEEMDINYNQVKEVGTIVYIAVNNNFIGSIVISDIIKPASPQAIRSLEAIGIKRTIILTGDNRNIADYVGQVLSIDEIYSELLPDEKVDILMAIEKTISKKGKLVFVGDGINDAPVLAKAHVGIAMGGVGSDAAIEAADVVLMTDNPIQVAASIELARNTQKIVNENVILCIGIKVLVLALAAAGLATMWMAVFADVGVTILAILNSLRALKFQSIT